VVLRKLIAGALWIGALLLVVLAVAGALLGILTAVGDRAAAEGVKGVALVALACFVLDALALVVLTALAVLAEPERPFSRAEDEAEEGPSEELLEG
jgi:hypothetical protein